MNADMRNICKFFERHSADYYAIPALHHSPSIISRYFLAPPNLKAAP